MFGVKAAHIEGSVFSSFGSFFCIYGRQSELPEYFKVFIFENKLSVWKFNKKQRICSQFHHVHKVVLHIFITFSLSNFLSSFFTILFNPSGQVIHMLKYYRMWFRLLRGANDTRKYKNRSFDSNISAKILVTLSL